MSRPLCSPLRKLGTPGASPSSANRREECNLDPRQDACSSNFEEVLFKRASMVERGKPFPEPLPPIGAPCMLAFAPRGMRCGGGCRCTGREAARPRA